MAAKPKKPGDSLFNNPILSDVKIKLHYKDTVCEYHAHKAVLASGSQFFSNAFTGRFIEASDNVIELHDDVPEHFEIALRFLYTQRYNKEVIANLAANDKVKGICIPIGVHVVADKYDIDLLAESIAEDLKGKLGYFTDRKTYTTAIQEFYAACSNAGNPVGKIISEAVMDHQPEYLSNAEFRILMEEFPCFGADVALDMHRRKTIDIHHQLRECKALRCKMINRVIDMRYSSLA